MASGVVDRALELSGLKTGYSQLSGLGASIIGGYHGMADFVTNVLTDPEAKNIQPGPGMFRKTAEVYSNAALNAANTVEDYRAKHTYQPPAGSGSEAVNSLLASNFNPLNWIPNAADAIGDKAAEVTGSPAIGAVITTAGNALAPRIAQRVGAGANEFAQGYREGRGLPPKGVAGPAPAAVNAQPSPTLNTTDPSKPVVQPAQQPGKPVPQQPPAKAAPKFSDPQAGVFAEANPDVPGGVPAAEQARRAKVLGEIGLDGNIRKSAITGNTSEAATDFQTSRLNSPAGQMMKATLEREKAAITGYAEKIAQDTGGSSMNDQAAKYSRGGTIIAPIEALKEWYDAKTKALYDVAAERAQGVPTQLDNFRSVLGDDSLATNSDRVQMRQAIQAYAKKLNIIREDGSVFSDGQQAEAMRQYLNEHWSPQNAGLVNKLKSALDEDVMSAAGEDVYGEARSLWKQKKDLLENPKGIANLIDASGPEGINRKVPIEKIADTVTTMPVDQLSHVINTLKNVPEELQPQAQQALAEIRAQFAHNVTEIGSKQAGQWNAKGVRQYLSNNSQRMKVVFEPDQLQRFGTLNDAGNILAKDQSYPGAHAQEQNLLRSGVSTVLRKGATAAGAGVGGVVGGPIGGVAGAGLGEYFGGRAADRVQTAGEVKQVQKRMVQLKDLLPPEKAANPATPAGSPVGGNQP